jgi:hypothetical protein
MKRSIVLRTFQTGLLFLFSAAAALAEPGPVSKHPRVAELEEKLMKDASSLIRTRFPDLPFLVTVSVDPLRRRSLPQTAEPPQDNLPFFDVQEDGLMQDEWDDPEVSLLKLLSRVRKTVVNISLPDSLSDPEVDEIKEFLFISLHLIQARDEVNIQRRVWKTIGTPWWLYGTVATSLIGFFLMGLLFINRSATRRISEAIADSAKGGGATSVVMAPAPAHARKDSGDHGTNGEMRLSDPVKLHEFASGFVKTLMEFQGFPSLEDFRVLDSLGRHDPQALGSILSEFPDEVRAKLFGWGRDIVWVEAMLHPGQLTLEAMDVLRGMMRHSRLGDAANRPWQELLIAVWRLDEKRDAFLQKVPSDTALAILAALPRQQSIASGRKLYPGSWAQLLNQDFKPNKPDVGKIEDMRRMAYEMVPLSDMSRVDRYRKELELVEYLHECEVAEERDIYLASAPGSLIYELRTPFFPVLELSEEEALQFVGRFSPDQWAYALHHVVLAQRTNILKTFNEKQRLLFVETEKGFESSPPDKMTLGDIRETIGKSFAEFRGRKAREAAAGQDPKLKEVA